MALLIGIDPGEYGAVVEIDTLEQIARFMRLPYTPDGLLDRRKLSDNFNLRRATYVYAEKIGPDPKFGAKGNWTFSHYNTSMLDWISDHAYTLVHPRTWQKRAHMGVSEKDKTAKQRTLIAFKRINPNFGEIGKRDDGIFDAFFIARFAGQENNISVPNDLLFIEV